MKQETKFKLKVFEKLKPLVKEGLWFTKTQQVSIRGTPDIIMCVNGSFVAWELKVDSQVDALQEYTLKSIRDAGGHAIVVTPENFEEALEDLKDTLEFY